MVNSVDLNHKYLIEHIKRESDVLIASNDVEFCLKHIENVDFDLIDFLDKRYNGVCPVFTNDFKSDVVKHYIDKPEKYIKFLEFVFINFNDSNRYIFDDINTISYIITYLPDSMTCFKKYLDIYPDSSYLFDNIHHILTKLVDTCLDFDLTYIAYKLFKKINNISGDTLELTSTILKNMFDRLEYVNIMDLHKVIEELYCYKSLKISHIIIDKIKNINDQSMFIDLIKMLSLTLCYDYEDIDFMDKIIINSLDILSKTQDESVVKTIIDFLESSIVEMEKYPDIINDNFLLRLINFQKTSDFNNKISIVNILSQIILFIDEKLIIFLSKLNIVELFVNIFHFCNNSQQQMIIDAIERVIDTIGMNESLKEIFIRFFTECQTDIQTDDLCNRKIMNFLNKYF